jgi:type IV pilus assembly protein PilB
MVGISMIDLDSILIDRDAVNMIPEDMCLGNCMIAFGKDENKIHVASKNALDSNLTDQIRLMTGKEVVRHAGGGDQILSAVYRMFSRENAEAALIRLKEEYDEAVSRQELIRERSPREEDSPVISLTRSIIIRAICMEASDIHLEPCENSVKVRFRIDGVLNEYMRMPKNAYSKVCSRIKVMAEIDITEKRVPQDGKIQMDYNGIKYDFRLSTLPTVYGEKIVIRILYSRKGKRLLEELGFDPEGISFIRDMLEHQHGIVLVTGPTGSGKSTTLYSMLSSMNSQEKNILTIEDPVEFSLEGINQVGVCGKTGVTFASGLRSLLRQDPDVIMIGEIRDEETARIAVRAAITGHLVLSTLHTNDSAASILRLIDMGVPAYLVSEAVVGIIAQRLVRKICIFCREEFPAAKEVAEILGVKEGEKIFRGTGCSKCNGTGYSGRTVVYEYNRIDSSKKAMIRVCPDIEEMRRRNFENGVNRLEENCRELVKNGITTWEEFQRITMNLHMRGGINHNSLLRS